MKKVWKNFYTIALKFSDEFNTNFVLFYFLRPQFLDTLFIVRLRPNTSMRCAVIINYYFLVHKMEGENLILPTQVLLQSNGLPGITSESKKHTINNKVSNIHTWLFQENIQN